MQTDDLKIRSWGLIGENILARPLPQVYQRAGAIWLTKNYLRKVAVADFDGICANTTFIIEAKKDKLTKDCCNI